MESHPANHASQATPNHAVPHRAIPDQAKPSRTGTKSNGSVRTLCVAELGSNHDGLFGRAKLLMRKAADAGASAIKFQCLPNLPREWLPDLKDYAGELGVELFATPFDVDAVHALAELGVPFIKIASVEATRKDLLEAAAETGIPIMLSTGMLTMTQIGEALDVIGLRGTTLLQCTVSYPTPADQANLRAIVGLREAFAFDECRVGFSDHTMSTVIPAAAVALGAVVVEKHLTLDRRLEGPDHPFALEPDEFKRMVANVREVELALGDGVKDGPRDGEMIELRGRRLQWQT